MRSFRVHASDPATQGPIPYLILNRTSQDRFQLDFESMAEGSTLPPLALSSQALYELLEGKEIVLRDETGTIQLTPEREELLISRQSSEGPNPPPYRVWLAELGLAWNMLSQPRGHRA